MMVAIRWPPNAGRVIFRLRSSRVQHVHAVPTCRVEASLQEVLMYLRNVNVQVGAVCAQTGVQTSCAAGAQVTADVGSADQQDLRLLSP